MDAPRRTATRVQLEHAALELFDRVGFEQTTVDDLAAAAGVGRRTFFRYFASKNDVVLGGLDEQLGRLDAELATVPVTTPLLDGVAAAFLAVNDYGPDELPVLRARMRLVHTVPELTAHAALRYLDWERVVAGYVAARTSPQPDTTMYPTVFAKAAIGVMQAVFAIWSATPGSDLPPLIREAFAQLGGGLPGGV